LGAKGWGVKQWGRDARLSLARLPAIGQTLGLARVPDAPLVAVRDPWPGSPARGARLMRGELETGFAPTRLELGGWPALSRLEEPAREIAHAFGWMRDLRAIGTDGARQRARGLVSEWIARPPSDPVSRRAPVIARRISAWLGHFDFFAASAEDEFRHALMQRLLADARMLAALVPLERADMDGVAALKGLVAAGVALPENTGFLARALRFLPGELGRQILPDGGHVERSPSAQLGALRELVEMKLLFATAGLSPPIALAACLDRMCPALRTLRLGDGGLALFNASDEEDSTSIDLVLGQAGRGRAVHPTLGETGFERLASGRTVLIIDAGVPAAPGIDRRAAAGTLSFEMSVGRERMIVNCGALETPEAWRSVLRATAAHSTLTIADTSSSEVRPDGLGKRPGRVVVQRQSTSGAHWLEASHDGYQRAFGATHHRRLYLAETGDDLRGEDALEGGDDVAYAIRFHLHPAVEVTLEADGEAALLRLASGGLFRLRADGARPVIEDSIYLGSGVRRPTRQIVLAARSGEVRQVRWAITRIA
jgi:uncharacterized heparinase superfamily protein